MTLYELIFILLFLGSVISGSVICLLLSGFLWRRSSSKNILVALASVWGVYLAILAITDAFSPQKTFKVGEEQCFDEMCFAVADAQPMPEQTLNEPGIAASRLYVVKIRVISHSRSHTQAEGGLGGRLYDEDRDAYINVSEAAQKAYGAQYGESSKLTQRIAPGESVLSVLVFEVPQRFTHLALTLDHGFTPGYFVIGESPFFHKPDIHLLPNDR
jgi:hypothetical protein